MSARFSLPFVDDERLRYTTPGRPPTPIARQDVAIVLAVCPKIDKALQAGGLERCPLGMGENAGGRCVLTFTTDYAEDGSVTHEFSLAPHLDRLPVQRRATITTRPRALPCRLCRCRHRPGRSRTCA